MLETSARPWLTRTRWPAAVCLGALGTIVAVTSAFYPLEMLGALLAVSMAAGIFAFPVAGLYLLLALFLIQSSPLYMTYGVFAGGGATVSDLLGLFVLGSFVLRWLLSQSHDHRWRVDTRAGAGMLAVAAFCGWQILGTAWSPASSNDIATLLRETIEAAVLFGLMVLLLNTDRRTRGAAAVYALTGMILALYTLATYLNYGANPGVNPIHDRAFRGGLPSTFNANELAIIIGMVPAFTFLAAEHLARRTRLVLTLATAPVTALALVILSSRGAFIAVAVGLVAAAVLSRGFQYRLALAVILLAAVGAVGFAVTTNNVPLYVQQRIAQSQYDQFGGRQPVWELALNTFAGHPLFGLGSGALEMLIPVEHVYVGANSAHSEYLDTLGNNGLVGFMALVAMLLVLVRTSIFRNGRNPGAIMVVFILLVSMAVDSFLLLHWFLPALAITYCIGLRADRAATGQAGESRDQTSEGIPG